MSFNGYRHKAMQDRAMIEELASGKKPQVIAEKLGCSYSTLRRRLSHYVQAIGCSTPEQAVAKHVAEKIKRSLPLALQSQVDMVMKRTK